MRHPTRLLAFLTIALLALPAMAESPQKEALTKELVKLSGLEYQLRQLPLVTMSQLAEQQGKVPEPMYKAFQRVFRDAYNTERLQRQVSKQVEKNLDMETMRKVLEWLQTELGKKITGLEEAASTPQGVQQAQVFAKQLQAAPPVPKRVDLVRRLNIAADTTELNLNIAQSTAIAVATAMDAVEPRDRRLGPDRVRIQVERQRPQMRQAYDQMGIVQSLYMYQPLSDGELERYVDFAESQLGREYHNVVTRAFEEALLDATTSMGKALAEAMKQFKTKKTA
ncbi:MAG: hypothetical protein ACREIS_11575 [Nitrospiraceae bacterium]